MGNDLKKVGLVFKADGEVDFRKSLQSVNSELSKNRAEFQLTQAKYDEHTKASTKLADRQQYLTKQYETQEDRIKVLRGELEEMEKTEGTSTRAIEKKRTQLLNAEKGLIGYDKELKEVNKSIEKGTSDLEEYGKKLENVGDKMTGVGKDLSMKVTAPIVGFGAVATKTFMGFDDSMRQVKATVGATEEEFEQLSATAQEMGKTTRFTASESADALNYLALAGYDVNQSIETLPKVLNLAAAGNLDLAYASDLVTDNMAALGLETSELDGFIDKMATTNQKSNTSVEQLGEAILVAGGQARLAKMPVTDMNTALGILGDNGIKGSEGGTALRNVLKNLMTPTTQGAKAMKELGLEVFDADGNMRPFNEILQDLNGSLEHLTDEEKTEAMGKIFDTRTIAGASALLKDSGNRWNELSEAIDGSEGSARKMADTLEEGVGGSWREMKSALEGLMIAFSENLAPILTDIIDKLADLFNWFSNLSDGQQKTITVVLLLFAALGPLLIIFGKMATGVGALIKVFVALKPIFVAITGPIGLIVIAVVALIAVFVLFGDKIKEVMDNVFNWITGIFGKVKTFFEGSVFLGMFAGVIQNFENILAAGKRIFGGLIDLIKGVFTGDWKKAWNGVKNIFGGIFDGLYAIAVSPLNLIIGALNGLIKGLNVFIKGVNKIKIPDWVPEIGGRGINLKTLGTIKYLAKGGDLLEGMAMVAEAGPELLLQQGNKTKVLPLSSGGGATPTKIIDYDKMTKSFLTALNGCELKLDDDGFVKIVDDRLHEVV